MADHRPSGPLAPEYLAPGIRRADNDDADLIANWLTQPAITRYLSSNLRANAMTPALIRAALRRRDQLWALFMDNDQKPLGLIALDQIDPVDSLANLWYLLGQSAQGRQGLTSAALRQLLDANPMQLATVTAWVGAPNEASRRCLMKAGFRQIGQITGAFVIDGQRHDRLLYEKILQPA